MICSSRSRDKFVKEGLSWTAAKYKATYLYIYLADRIKTTQAKLRRNPNEIDEWILDNLQRNKTILFNEKDESKVNYILDKLYSDLNYVFKLGGK